MSTEQRQTDAGREITSEHSIMFSIAMTFTLAVLVFLYRYKKPKVVKASYIPTKGGLILHEITHARIIESGCNCYCVVRQFGSGYWFAMLMTEEDNVCMESLGNFLFKQEAIDACEIWLRNGVAKELIGDV